jgi:Spy/CpxP family protein refolding chaperone
MARRDAVRAIRALVCIGSVSTAALSVAPTAAGAQTVATAATRKLSLEELTTQWASLERPLIGVTDLSDQQRDVIELLEDKYRRLFADESTPLRNARLALAQRGPFDRIEVERALDRIAELRKLQLVQMRQALTEAQRVRYDANVKEIAAEEAAAIIRRERDAAFYTP